MSVAQMHTGVFDSARLERVFGECFGATFNTRLVGGAEEPLYRPAADADGENLLFYRADYFASALHETAHWCIAGAARRRRVDFGYWYEGDGRGPQQQRAFEAMEARPQALEWFFSRACGWPFRVSLDNLEGVGEPPDSTGFRRQVTACAQQWQARGLPTRAAQFYGALCTAFGTATPAASLRFDAADIG